MDWENLHYFSVFAQQKTLSGAARLLKVDHATVARRISALEKQLQLKLVDRRARTYVLTAEGEKIAGMAARMMEDSYAIGRIAKAGQAVLKGEVSMSLPPATAAHFIVPRLHTLRQEYPQLHLRVIVETRFASLQHSEADIALRLARPAEEGLVGRKIAQLPFGLYASVDYLADRVAAQYEFIGLDDSLSSSLQQRWLAEICGGRPIVLKTNSPDMQRLAAEAGVGVAILPCFMGEQSGLQRIPCERVSMMREVWLAVHQDLRHSPLIRVVMDFLVACFEDVPDTGKIMRNDRER